MLPYRKGASCKAATQRLLHGRSFFCHKRSLSIIPNLEQLSTAYPSAASMESSKQQSEAQNDKSSNEQLTMVPCQ
jgi:hypothetical protein